MLATSLEDFYKLCDYTLRRLQVCRVGQSFVCAERLVSCGPSPGFDWITLLLLHQSVIAVSKATIVSVQNSPLKCVVGVKC